MPEKTPHYLYIFEMLGYGPHNSHSTKVGVSKNIERRINMLWYSYGGLIPHLHAFFEFDCERTARKAESELLAALHPPEIGKELFDKRWPDVLQVAMPICSELGGKLFEVQE